MKARRELARRDPNRFMEYCLLDKKNNPIKQGKIHRSWQEGITEHQHVLIEAPRDHGKTTQIIGRIIWELGKNPNEQFTLICANEDKAKKRLREIRTHIERNPRVHEVFPGLQVDEGTTTTKLALKRRYISKNYSVEAYGVMSAGTGDRAGVVVFDDVCDRRNSLTVPGFRRAVIEAYENDWMNLLDRNGRSWYLFTPWHKEDLSSKLVDEGTIPIIKHMVKAEWNDQGEATKIVPVWPEVWDEAALRNRLAIIKRRAFLRSFCGFAVDEGERLIYPHWFRYGWPSWNLTDAVRIQAWDGAAPYRTKSDKPDFVAHCDLYVNLLASQVFVANAWRGRGLTLHGQVQEVAKRAKSGPPPAWIIIEQQGESALASSASEAWHLFPEDTTIIPYGTRGQSKGQRLQDVSPLLENGMVLFAPHLDPEEGDAVPLVEELLDFPFGENDDVMDTFVYGLILAKRIANFHTQEDKPPKVKVEVAAY